MLQQTIRLQVVNWNRMGLTFNKSFPITNDVTAGRQAIQIPLNVAEFYNDYRVAGRFTFVMDVTTAGQTMNYGQFMGFLDDKDFSIPPRTRGSVVGRILIILAIMLAS